MKKNAKKVILYTILIIIFSILVFERTYSYFGAITNANNEIQGSTYTFDINLSMTSIKNGTLIPVVDTLVPTSLSKSTKCVDDNGLDICSIYKITVSNTGEAITLKTNIKTLTGTTYTTNHLKAALYELKSGSYASLSDGISLSKTVNTKNYFNKSGNNIEISLAKNASKDVYLVLWLSDINANQLEDVNKKYVGSIEFFSNSGTASNTFTQ